MKIDINNSKIFIWIRLDLSIIVEKPRDLNWIAFIRPHIAMGSPFTIRGPMNAIKFRFRCSSLLDWLMFSTAFSNSLCKFIWMFFAIEDDYVLLDLLVPRFTLKRVGSQSVQSYKTRRLKQFSRIRPLHCTTRNARIIPPHMRWEVMVSYEKLLTNVYLHYGRQFLLCCSVR